MPNVFRMRIPWTGPAVTGPSVTTLYADPTVTGFSAAVVDFFTTLAPLLPVGVSITVPGEGDQLDVATGELSGVWSDGGGGTVVGGFSQFWAQGVGARIVWNTAGISGGRRVRGSTFIVPLTVNSYDGAGGLMAGTVTTLTSAADGFILGMGGAFVVYSRPKPTEAGALWPVSSRTIPDAVSWLRSRRT